MTESSAPEPSAPAPKKAPSSEPKVKAKKAPKSASAYFKPITSKATSTQANRTIILAVGTGIGVVLLARIAGTPGVERLNHPGQLIKIAVGSGATIIFLMVIAEVAPDVAIGLAWLILFGALLTYGVDFARALMKGTLTPGVPLTPWGSSVTKGVGKVPRPA